ncbi:hypothetical protein [Actinomyces sp.]|uniref:hypothetical protein n=1 Tax=Actinomyces sp. TaxID=29317 RepID=UPI0026DC2F29|nr:hypothetical protein [Actinomyces sp.]MDO4899618.1 hypothetical protein [Actinomyces sp.]
MFYPLFSVEFLPANSSCGLHCGLAALARVLLDLAGFGFLLIALVFAILNAYGVVSGMVVRRRSARRVRAGTPIDVVAQQPSEHASGTVAV